MVSWSSVKVLGTRRLPARLRACLVVPGARLAAHEFNPRRLQPDRIDDDLFLQQRPQVDGDEDFFGFNERQLRNDARRLADQQIRNPQSQRECLHLDAPYRDRTMEPLLHLRLQGGPKTVAVQQEGKGGKRKQRQRDHATAAIRIFREFVMMTTYHTRK